MSAVVLYMSMSLDGFIAGPNQSVDNGLGDEGERLHDWILNGSAVPDDLRRMTPRLEGANRQVIDELMSTGAVVTGRGTFEAAGAWGGDHHDGVPIFVVQRSAPEPKWTASHLVTHVADVAEAVQAAKRAAGERTSSTASRHGTSSSSGCACSRATTG